MEAWLPALALVASAVLIAFFVGLARKAEVPPERPVPEEDDATWLERREVQRGSRHAARRPPSQSPSPSSKRVVAGRKFRGRVHVIDGDTIVIGKTKIRLWGIDAPELDEPWGQKSKWAMVRLCKGEVVTAICTGDTSYDRYVAKCYLNDGRDLSAELVREGLALDWPMFSGGAYRSLETTALRRKLAFVRNKTRAGV